MQIAYFFSMTWVDLGCLQNSFLNIARGVLLAIIDMQHEKNANSTSVMYKLSS